MKKICSGLISLFFLQFVVAQVNLDPADSIKRIRHQDDSMIRAYRTSTNELMADHNARGMGRYWMPDYVRMSGSGNLTVGKDSAIVYWSKVFKDQPTIFYVRIPEIIQVSENGIYAWEVGKWTGMNTKSKGGNYAAQWVKKENIWKIQSEYFITLSTY